MSYTSQEEHTTLRNRIASYSIDAPDHLYPFSHRLASEQRWSIGYTARVIEEYKRFLYLAVTAPHPVSPSHDVDQAWHLHLTYTRSYWDDLCATVLGMPLHHEPTAGGSAETRKFDDWYRRTLEAYEEAFGEPPPPDIWPLRPPYTVSLNNAGVSDSKELWPRQRLRLAGTMMVWGTAGSIALLVLIPFLASITSPILFLAIFVAGILGVTAFIMKVASRETTPRGRRRRAPLSFGGFYFPDSGGACGTLGHGFENGGWGHGSGGNHHGAHHGCGHSGDGDGHGCGGHGHGCGGHGCGGHGCGGHGCGGGH